MILVYTHMDRHRRFGVQDVHCTAILLVRGDWSCCGYIRVQWKGHLTKTSGVVRWRVPTLATWVTSCPYFFLLLGWEAAIFVAFCLGMCNFYLMLGRRGAINSGSVLGSQSSSSHWLKIKPCTLTSSLPPHPHPHSLWISGTNDGGLETVDEDITHNEQEQQQTRADDDDDDMGAHGK